MIMLFIVPPQITYFWPILLLAYKYAATIGMLPSQQKNQGTTVLQLPTQHCCLDATFPMPFCKIQRNGSQKHIICTYFFQ